MDMNHDCQINLADFAELAKLWLDCSLPNDPACGLNYTPNASEFIRRTPEQQ
jgi:hypothetical protein